MFSEWGCAKGRRFSYHGDNKVFLDPGGPWYEEFFEVSIGNGTVVVMYWVCSMDAGRRMVTNR